MSTLTHFCRVTFKLANVMPCATNTHTHTHTPQSMPRHSIHISNDIQVVATRKILYVCVCAVSLKFDVFHFHLSLSDDNDRIWNIVRKIRSRFMKCIKLCELIVSNCVRAIENYNDGMSEMAYRVCRSVCARLSKRLMRRVMQEYYFELWAF